MSKTFTMRFFRKFVVEADKYTPAHDDLLAAAINDAPTTITNEERGIRGGACFKLVLPSRLAEFKLRTELTTATKRHKASSRVSNSSVSSIIGCHNCASCPIGASCTRASRKNGRQGPGIGVVADAVARLHATGIPQYVPENLFVSPSDTGLRIFHNDGAEMYADAVPEIIRDAEISNAIDCYTSTHVFCTRKYHNWVRHMNEGRWRNMFREGLITNIVFNLSVSTRAEAYLLEDAWNQLDKRLKLKVQLSLRPLLEDGIQIADVVLKDPRIPHIAGNTAGMIDWNKIWSAAELPIFTKRAEVMIDDVYRRSGKRIIMDTYGSAMPVTVEKRGNRTVFVEKGVRYKLNKSSKLYMKGGEVINPTFRGEAITPESVVKLKGGMYLPLSRQPMGRYTGPVVDDNSAFIAAQLQAPVSG